METSVRCPNLTFPSVPFRCRTVTHGCKSQAPSVFAPKFIQYKTANLQSFSLLKSLINIRRRPQRPSESQLFYMERPGKQALRWLQTTPAANKPSAVEPKLNDNNPGSMCGATLPTTSSSSSLMSSSENKKITRQKCVKETQQISISRRRNRCNSLWWSIRFAHVRFSGYL